jgi:hypothetical protein
LYLIVGVDPGTTTGVAALDFRGRVIDLFSSKDMSMDKVIERLVSVGRVSVIASDVSPVPSAVSKLAAQLGAVVESPGESLRVDEKIELVRPYKIENSHQRDSLAAALSTFCRFRNKFQKIESLGLGDEVKHLVLRGHSIDEAAKMLSPAPPKVIVSPQPPAEERSLSAEQIRIRSLEKQNQFLKKHLGEKDRAIKNLNNRMAAERSRYLLEVTRDREVRSRDQHILSLQSSIADLRRQIRNLERMKELISQISSGEIKAVGIFPQASGGLTYIRRKLKKHDIPSLRNVKVAFTAESANHPVLAECGVIAADPEYLWEVAGSYFIMASDLLQLKPKAVSIDRLIEEYRSSRTT